MLIIRLTSVEWGQPHTEWNSPSPCWTGQTLISVWPALILNSASDIFKGIRAGLGRVHTNAKSDFSLSLKDNCSFSAIYSWHNSRTLNLSWKDQFAPHCVLQPSALYLHPAVFLFGAPGSIKTDSKLNQRPVPVFTELPLAMALGSFFSSKAGCMQNLFLCVNKNKLKK